MRRIGISLLLLALVTGTAACDSEKVGRADASLLVACTECGISDEDCAECGLHFGFCPSPGGVCPPGHPPCPIPPEWSSACTWRSCFVCSFGEWQQNAVDCFCPDAGL